jgi:hypothetical protein
MRLTYERATSSWQSVLALAVCTLTSLPLAAQEEAPRLVVLQSDGAVSPKLRKDVDGQLRATLARRPAFQEAYVSPVPFEDVELAAGCNGREASCFQRIAATLDADWIMVRELTRDERGHVYLTLVAHDGSGAIVTRRAVAEVSATGRQTPQQVVPLLVDRLYPESKEAQPLAQTSVLPRPRAEPSRTTQTLPKERSPAKIVGWSSLAAGSAMVAAGAVMGALSRRDELKHNRASINGELEAERAGSLFNRATRRTNVANGLIIGGATAGTAGVAALLWDYFRPPRDKRVSVRVLPARSGVALSLRANFRGGF